MPLADAFDFQGGALWASTEAKRSHTARWSSRRRSSKATMEASED